MPWVTPTLRSVRETVRGEITAKVAGASFVGNSVLRVLGDAMAAVAHLTLRYLDWLSKQLLPDTAEAEWLDRHGDIWLVNADGSTGRKAASMAHGSVLVTGTQGTIIPNATQLTNGAGFDYETTAQITLSSSPTPVNVIALQGGAGGNMLDGDILPFTSAISGVNGSTTVVTLTGGADQETDEELRSRILLRIRNPPMGGSEADYVQWALAVPGVTRAWAGAEQGAGTVTVRFLMDDLRASDDGWPTPDDVNTVAAYIDTKRPVAVKDCYVFAPIKEFIDITIANLVPNSTETQAEIQASIQDMLFVKAAPGQTIFASWVSYAISSAPSVQSFNLVTDTDYVMPSLGHMAVLETILYE